MSVTNVFFAFLDILGFKDLIKNNPPDMLGEFYQSILEPSVHAAIADGKFAQDKHPDLYEAHVSSLTISDSVMFWTADDHPERFLDLVKVVRQVMINSMIAGIPLRGAIASGALLVQSNSFENGAIRIGRQTVAGEALVKAYEWESRQQWSGCLIDPEVVQIVRAEKHMWDSLIAEGLLVEYPTPLNHETSTQVVLNWIRKTQFRSDQIRTAFHQHNKQVTDERVERKITNTVRFVEEMLELEERMYLKENLFPTGRSIQSRAIPGYGLFVLVWGVEEVRGLNLYTEFDYRYHIYFNPYDGVVILDLDLSRGKEHDTVTAQILFKADYQRVALNWMANHQVFLMISGRIRPDQTISTKDELLEYGKEDTVLITTDETFRQKVANIMNKSLAK